MSSTISTHYDNIVGRYGVRHFIGDPSGSAMAAECTNKFMMYQLANNDIDEGIRAVNEALASGKLTISPDCVNLLRELSAYEWNPLTGKPRKVNDHACDALRYLVMEVINLTPVKFGGL